MNNSSLNNSPEDSEVTSEYNERVQRYVLLSERNDGGCTHEGVYGHHTQPEKKIVRNKVKLVTSQMTSWQLWRFLRCGAAQADHIAQYVSAVSIAIVWQPFYPKQDVFYA